MIRVYFDWNVISKLKSPEFRELNEFISNHKDILQCFYSPAHFNDLMKSYKPSNKLFHEDLNTLEQICGCHLLCWNDNSKNFTINFLSPKSYFEGVRGIQDDFLHEHENLVQEFVGFGWENIINDLPQVLSLVLESNSEYTLLLKDLFSDLTPNTSMKDILEAIASSAPQITHTSKPYKSLRASIKNSGLKLDADKSNWGSHEEANQIDALLPIKQLLGKYAVNQFQYMLAYLLLDLLSNLSDKMKKGDMQNLLTDSQHSFYATQCDFLITDDDKLLQKSQVLYENKSIITRVIATSQFIETIQSKLHIPNREKHFVDESLELISQGDLIMVLPCNNENPFETEVYKLPIFYFNYFTHAHRRINTETHCLELKFDRTPSDFILYSELYNMIERVCRYFGVDDENEFREKSKEFVQGDQGTCFEWRHNNTLILLYKDMVEQRPILYYSHLSSLCDVQE